MNLQNSLLDVMKISSEIVKTPINTYHKNPFYAVPAAEMDKLRKALEQCQKTLSELNGNG